MKVLTSKIVNGKKMFLIEDNNPQGKVFAQDGKPIKKENISNYNPYYVDVKGLNASESTKTNLTPATKITPQEIKKIKESPTNVGNIKIKEAQEKAQRLKEAEEAYKKRKAGAPITPELLAQETQAIGDKISLQNIPGVGQYIPDMLDVTGGIGSMASNLGALPLNLNRGNYGQALLSVAAPLATGALAGIGTQNTGQFVNNIVNPLAGTGELINNLGNKYLPNVYKLNPWAFKPNPEMMYRGIGKEGMEDALESGVFRAKQNVQPSLYGGFDLSKEFKSTYYTPKFNIADQYGKGFIVEVPKDVTPFRLRYKGKGNKTWSQIADENIPIEKGRILQKDWLRRYKEVPKPQQTFKSEIDWSKWNKEIPNNSKLIKEYNTIEQTSKANGTWMKNPDGSIFDGTPEQFVQQNSEHFKKAFGNSIVRDEKGNIIKMYHGSINKEPLTEYITPKRLKDFKRRTQTTKETDHTFFSPKKEIADKYSKRDLLGNDKGIIYENYINVKNPYFTNDYMDLATPHNLPNINSYDAVTNMKFGKDYSPKDYSELAIPFGNNVKSAIGNNGMFDMTNPNIYKTIVGGLATGTLGKEAMRKKEFGGKIKILKTKISNGKTLHLIED